MAGAEKRARGVASASDIRGLPDERTEIVGQLHRSLALLRGCDAPGARAQIASLVASLTARLQHLEPTGGFSGRTRLADLIPSAGSCAVQPLECRAYAIQCESLASMASADQRQMLLALARLWRALAQSGDMAR